MNIPDVQQALYDRIPENKIGEWYIRKENQPKSTIYLCRPQAGHEYIWMSNRDEAEGTHDLLRQQACGNVLIAGLGLGYDILLICDQEIVKSIDVVEIHQEVIDLVAQYIANPKTQVIHDRILHYLENCEKWYNLIWFDIYPCDPVFFADEVKILNKAAQRRLKSDGKILHWRSQSRLDL